MNISFNKRFLFFLFICFFIYLQGIFKLPVMDRDEARFATASKTMLIEKDFIDIKMVEEKRYANRYLLGANVEFNFWKLSV